MVLSSTALDVIRDPPRGAPGFGLYFPEVVAIDCTFRRGFSPLARDFASLVGVPLALDAGPGFDCGRARELGAVRKAPHRRPLCCRLGGIRIDGRPSHLVVWETAVAVAVAVTGDK